MAGVAGIWRLPLDGLERERDDLAAVRLLTFLNARAEDDAAAQHCLHSASR